MYLNGDKIKKIEIVKYNQVNPDYITGINI